MKPTQISCQPGGTNQICPWTEVRGDIRLSPFAEPSDAVATVQGAVKESAAAGANF